MKTLETVKTLTLPDGYEIDVTVKYIWQNDGIGAYEYWGAKCFDHGHDYVEIVDVVPTFVDETEEQRKEILRFINEDTEKCDAQLTEMIEEESERLQEEEYDQDRDL